MTDKRQEKLEKEIKYRNKKLEEYKKKNSRRLLNELDEWKTIANNRALGGRLMESEAKLAQHKATKSEMIKDEIEFLDLLWNWAKPEDRETMIKERLTKLKKEIE